MHREADTLQAPSADGYEGFMKLLVEKGYKKLLGYQDKDESKFEDTNPLVEHPYVAAT
jgi:hypothetical protein